MKFIETKISGLYVIELELKADERGYFARIFCEEEFKKIGVDFKIAQASRSFNKKCRTIRGMHFQKEPKAEDKIVQCIKGEIYDVAVDLRPNSRTFGQWVAQKLSEENQKMFFIPKGFAHGFQVLKDNSEVQYFISEFYSPECGSGVRWNDPLLNIDWPMKDPVLLDKDKNWPLIQK